MGKKNNNNNEAIGTQKQRKVGMQKTLIVDLNRKALRINLMSGRLHIKCLGRNSGFSPFQHF